MVRVTVSRAKAEVGNTLDVVLPRDVPVLFRSCTWTPDPGVASPEVEPAVILVKTEPVQTSF